jgi:hypothetical protein
LYPKKRYAAARISQHHNFIVSEVIVMMSYKTIALVAGMSFALATGAATVTMAEPASDGTILLNCAGEVKKFCTDKKYAKQKIRTCLEAQKGKLSKQCKATLEKK